MSEKFKFIKKVIFLTFKELSKKRKKLVFQKHEKNKLKIEP